MTIAGPIQPLSREPIYAALLDLVWPAYDWKNDKATARRIKLWADVPIEQRPALYQFEGGEESYTYSQRPGVKRVLPCTLFVYGAAKEQTDIGATLLNSMLDAVEATLLPLYSDAAGGAGQRLTLGGLVSSVRIDGKINRVPGDIDGDVLGMIPLLIECP